MKKISLIPALLLVIVFTTSCSKEKTDNNTQTSATRVPNQNKTGVTERSRPPVNTGSLTGRFFPIPDKAVVSVFNDSYTSAEVLADSSGVFFLNDIPSGSYYLRVYYVLPGAPDYARLLIPKVVVTAGITNDIGIITL